MEEKLLPDATGRNALFKVHVALGKLHNALQEADAASSAGRMRTTSRSVSVASTMPPGGAGGRAGTATSDTSMASGGDRTVVPADPEIKEEPEDEDVEMGEAEGDGEAEADTSSGTVVMKKQDSDAPRDGVEGESIIDELLSDED